METEEKVETAPKKRGRPKKIPDAPVNETPVVLQMTQQSPATKETANFTKVNKVLMNKTGTQITDLNKYNPFMQNQRLKMISAMPAELSRDELLKALMAPQNSELQIRGAAAAMASKQYMYYKILRMACDIPLFKWYVTPELQEKKSDYKKDEFIEEDEFVNNWLKSFDVVNTLKRVSLEVAREGKCTYVLRSSVSNVKSKRRTNFAAWQKLPSNYVKLVKIGTHGFIASFNMMLFLNPMFSVEQYPEFIQDIWYDMIESGAVTKNSGRYEANVDKLATYSYDYHSQYGSSETLSGRLEILSSMENKEYAMWVQLPQDLCYTFSSDTSVPYAIPDTAGLLLSLEELADYDTLQGLIDSTPLVALLTAEAELINDPAAGLDQTAMSPESIVGLQEHFNTSTSTNLEALFAPLKNFKLLTLPTQANNSEISTIATRNLVSRSGLGGIMITTDKPSVSQVKAALALEESKVTSVTKQFESVLNMIINDVIGTRYDWNLHIWGNAFSYSEEVSRDKELLISGVTVVLPKICSAYDISIREAKSIENYIDTLELYDGFRTITQASQEKAKAEEEAQKQQSQGRPEKSLDEIDNDNTAASKDSGLDTADTRYSEEEEEDEEE